MNESEIRQPVTATPSNPWDATARTGRPDVRGSLDGFTSAAQWGLASLLIGCTLLLAACVTLGFNVVLFHAGPRGIPTGLAFAGGLIGALVVAMLGLTSIMFGIRGWQHASAAGSSHALPIAGVAASAVGLVAWLIAAIDLMMILLAFNNYPAQAW